MLLDMTMNDENCASSICSLNLSESYFKDQCQENDHQCVMEADSSNEENNFTYVQNLKIKVSSLQKEMEKCLQQFQSNMNCVFFVGNTGAGKSALVQLLAGDNSMLNSTTTAEGSNNFIITGDDKIGTDITKSCTLYPELIIDKNTNNVLCDNPGFRDTRVPEYEFIAMLSMKQLMNSIDKIKVVLVCVHSSLQIGMYKDDFTNLLKHVSEFFSDTKKLKGSISLVCTKVENVVLCQNSVYTLVSDENVVAATAHFLEKVKSSLLTESEGSVLYPENMINIINCLLEKDDNNKYTHIGILRKPMQEGKISENSMFQSQRSWLREMLLSNENFTKVESTDFHITLSDKCLKFLDDFVERLNLFTKSLSKKVSLQLIEHYKAVIDDLKADQIENVIKIISEFKDEINSLCNGIKEVKTPNKFTNVINDYYKKNKIISDTLVNVYSCTLNDLEYIYEFFDMRKFTSENWSLPLRDVSDFLKGRLDQCKFFTQLHLKLSEYKIQKERFQNYTKLNFENDQNDETLKILLNEFDFNEFDIINNDKFVHKNVNYIINITLNFECKHYINEEKSLIIYGYIILLSDILSIICKYKEVEKIIIFSIHTIYFDFSEDLFKGKNLTIVAPIWEVIGSCKINLDGENGGPDLVKASAGEIGIDGQCGKPGGKFTGIGMKFINCNHLKINANGGKGQNGQDGGDGINGKNGKNAKYQENSFLKKLYSKSFNIGVYSSNEEKNLYPGTEGEKGGDSGEGGRGGKGGKKGKVEILSINDKNHHISSKTEKGKRGSDGKNGEPGKGGRNGSNVVVEKRSNHVLFFIPVFSNEKANAVAEEEIRAPDGKVRKAQTQKYECSESDSEDEDENYFTIGKSYRKLTNFIFKLLNEFDLKFYDSVTKTFMDKMKGSDNLID
ncbi:uncharacterized protein LOC142319396 isoform X2 [Lycorma delicatula]|uniref:uncharacterized protein LOC142319396 isoform X2 n=1 Tax=Lycorma delicatula TaxID=130591 RepID=UPI003F50F736